MTTLYPQTIIRLYPQSWGGVILVVKKGTKLTDNPKDTTVKVRMDKDTMDKLDKCVEVLESNRSEIIRAGIKKIYDELERGWDSEGIEEVKPWWIIS